MLYHACFCHHLICGHRWVQGECRRLGDTDAPEVDPMLQRAASALRERPVLFKYCAAEVAGARHNALFQRSGLPASSVFSSILSGLYISITICNHTKLDATLSLRQQHNVASHSIHCTLSVSSMSVQVYRGPDKGWRGRHAAADRDACT